MTKIKTQKQLAINPVPINVKLRLKGLKLLPEHDIIKSNG